MKGNKIISEKVFCGTYTLSGQRKGRSSLWNILSEINNELGEVITGFVYCRKCSAVLKYKNSQTSNLQRHNCCKVTNKKYALKQISAEDKNEATKICANWIIEDCRPFSAVQGTGFIKMIKFFTKLGAIYGENVDVDDLLPLLICGLTITYGEIF